MASRMTPERVAEFVRRYQNGETIYKISRDMEVTYKTVKLHLEKAGVYDESRVDARYKHEVFKKAPKDRTGLSKTSKKSVKKEVKTEKTEPKVVEKSEPKVERTSFVYGSNLVTGNKKKEETLKTVESLNFAEVTKTGVKKPKKQSSKAVSQVKKPMSKQKETYLNKLYGKGNWVVMTKEELLDCLIQDLAEY